REELRANGQLPAARALAILRSVCAAVEAAHERQLVHRDLKPENIFLSKTSQGEVVKVLDFGVAKLLTPAADVAGAGINTADGVLLGTLPYMAPEQLRGEAVSAAADVWALAIIAHEMLTGRHPFANALAAIVNPSSAPVEPNGALRGFFDYVLSPDAGDRPATPAVFLAHLERAVTA